ncbi:MAG: prepilin-type N-terminal cleavage/methylation domain-containing protein [Nitrospira sp.]|nr:prepilin-type N-terminal cleavage/methylation domain-containing protein [Nitrospira sp.]
MLVRQAIRDRRLLNDQQGFTLLEIMIVVAIIGISAALAVPNFTMMYARHELYQTTTSLYNRLVFARSSAISRNAMIVATPANVPGSQSQVTFTAPLGVETLPLNVTFVLPLPATPIGFTPRGLSTISGQPVTIQLQSVRDPTLIYSISLAPSGKVTWCSVQITPCIQNQ